jgi:hypothetical protein
MCDPAVLLNDRPDKAVCRLLTSKSGHFVLACDGGHHAGLILTFRGRHGTCNYRLAGDSTAASTRHLPPLSDPPRHIVPQQRFVRCPTDTVQHLRQWSKTRRALSSRKLVVDGKPCRHADELLIHPSSTSTAVHVAPGNTALLPRPRVGELHHLQWDHAPGSTWAHHVCRSGRHCRHEPLQLGDQAYLEFRYAPGTCLINRAVGQKVIR